MYAPNPEVTAELQKKDDLPVFKKRWWHKANRLDARPVIWSLDNRPGDWETAKYPGGEGRWMTLLHKPSGHEFYFGYGEGPHLRTESTDCSCTNSGGRFQMFQKGAIRNAYWRWHDKVIQPAIDAQNEANAKQFYNHFVTP